MSGIAFEIFFILLLIVANGVFSGSEIAIVSSRRVRLEQLAKNGDRKAKLALKLANSPNNFLSTVQIGITLIGILSGAVGGATLAQRLEGLLGSIPLLYPYREVLSFAIVVSIITYLSLVVGELVPKRLALNSPEPIACAVAGPMRWLSRAAAPVVYLLGISTDLLLKMLGLRESQESPVTEEEIKILLDQATQAGTFEEAERQLVGRVFRLGDRPIRALMTPRTEIVWLDLNKPLNENWEIAIASGYSRFPVGHGSLDRCLGIARLRNLFEASMAGETINLEAKLQSPLYVTETMQSLKVLELFKKEGTRVALVSDEYGGIEGLVTLSDLVEALVGELPSLEDLDEPMSVRREDGSWLLDGLLSADDLKDLLNREVLPYEARGEYHTLGGLMMTHLGHIPTAGEYFEWSGLRFEVMDMDGIRVDKVLVSELPAEPTLPESGAD
ncbi:hemolysin family protein [Oscillatoria sp. FACHB-1406]|uniref:hemolysin family protein n=1 Tax=Oscillatoria sp. FACHB-1406 TaxID=2692846 RepID=UPI0016862116|nr:hemolysin family protein [Oscillatoria sp. FACHB-1406]MBD2578918.1 HlyC/CorC family transporter [Oscillatoria sp. FACHB-1406]